LKKLFDWFIALLKKRFVFLRTTISGFDIHKQTNKSSKVDTLSYKTKSANRSTVKKEWILVDANDQVLGRLASKVAVILRGKHKPDFTPHVDCGDNVIIINADKVKLTGKKMSDRQYFRHTGYPGGQVIDTPERLMARKPGAVVENAIRGMLPKNRLGRELFRNLHVYPGAEHPHEAQQPRELKLNDIK
jgi:large subunit ribosomal protein L13